MASTFRILCQKSLIFIQLFLQGCEREVAEAEKGSSDELKNECKMRLSWALVHSKRPEDVQRGIAMLEGDKSTWNFLIRLFLMLFV